MKQKIWIVLTDSNTCKIYDYHKTQHEVTLIKQLQHLSSRLHDMDLVSDKPGRYQTSSHAHGVYESRHDPKELEVDKFASEIALELEKSSGQYDQVIIITLPHFLGLLNNHINKEIKNKILMHINKDYLHLSEQELIVHLKDSLT